MYRFAVGQRKCIITIYEIRLENNSLLLVFIVYNVLYNVSFTILLLMENLFFFRKIHKYDLAKLNETVCLFLAFDLNTCIGLVIVLKLNSRHTFDLLSIKMF